MQMQEIQDHVRLQVLEPAVAVLLTKVLLARVATFVLSMCSPPPSVWPVFVVKLRPVMAAPLMLLCTGEAMCQNCNLVTRPFIIADNS